MFSEEEFKADKELWDSVIELKTNREIKYGELLETAYLFDLKKKSPDEFLLQMIQCYCGLVFTCNIDLKAKIGKLLNNSMATKWLIPLSDLNEQISNLSNAVNGQVLKGFVLARIFSYLELKIALELMDWGNKVEDHNGKDETIKLVKIFDNIYRRKEYAGTGLIKPKDEFDSLMIGVTNEFDEKIGSIDVSKRYLLRSLHGNIEKLFANIIIQGISIPLGKKMSQKEFHSLLFDLLFLIFKDIGWLSFKKFEEIVLDSDTEKYNSYQLPDSLKTYRLYKARQVKSILSPSKN